MEMTNDILAKLPQLRPIESAAVREALAAAAKEDAHSVVGATHVITKRGQIVGYASIGSILMLNTWVHSKKVDARDSLEMLNMCENVAAALGQKTICLPVDLKSPFYPHVERLGYTRLGNASFNLKHLKGAQ